MENASKALIIAGAILIAILLISVGIIVMNNTNKPIDAAAEESKSQAAQIFNSKFESYVGTNKSASEVKSLINAVASNTDKNHGIAMKLFIYNSSGTITTSINCGGKDSSRSNS